MYINVYIYMYIYVYIYIYIYIYVYIYSAGGVDAAASGGLQRDTWLRPRYHFFWLYASHWFHYMVHLYHSNHPSTACMLFLHE